MTAIADHENTIVQTDRSRLTRTFAMTVVGVGYLAIVADLLFFMVALVLPAADEPIGAVLIPMFGAIIVVFSVIAATTLVWSGARRRAWFWLAVAVPPLLLLLLNARQIPYDISHPASTSPFLVTIVVLAGTLATVAGGIAAFVEVRRGGATMARSGRAGLLIVAGISVVVGAAATSLLAGSTATASRAGLAETPTVTGTITAENIMFTESRLEMRSDDVLGLFVINRDGIPHAFEVDSLGIHVDLPPNSTTAVAIEPTGPGDLEFYCGVGGHRGSGMVGTIAVE
jgi:uncharacterized cupredoxin-like copper-binding protein